MLSTVTSMTTSSAVFQRNSSEIALHEKSKALGQQRLLISDREGTRTVLIDPERFCFQAVALLGLTK